MAGQKVMLLFEIPRECERGYLFGIAKYAREHGNWQLFRKSLSYRDPSQSFTFSDKEIAEADGIIIGDVEMARLNIPKTVPTISIAVHAMVDGVPNIMGDNHGVAMLAADHLILQGLANFAYCGFDDIFWSRERGECFVKILKDKSYAVDSYKSISSRSGIFGDYELENMVKWLKGLPKPVGLLACNDDRAHEVLMACRAGGLSIPDDIAVLGVDNDEIVCITSEPSLSSIGFNFEKAGYQAARLLDKMMEGGDIKEDIITLLPSQVMPRKSTNILAVSDNEVAKALGYIRKHPRREMKVVDIVNKTSLSRRVLERRFRADVGTSIAQEIRRVRADFISRLLLETDLSIYQIVLELGYSDVAHIARFFKSQTGLTPQELRNKHKLL